MSRKDKLIKRLLSRPKDFTWSELIKLLAAFGYQEVITGKTGGSRARFVREGYPPITLHRPHPKPVLKGYQLDNIV